MSRGLVQIDGRPFGAVAISDSSGFPCVVAVCRIRFAAAGRLVADLRAAREQRDAHIAEAHPGWRPDLESVRVVYDATFTGRHGRRAAAGA